MRVGLVTTVTDTFSTVSSSKCPSSVFSKVTSMKLRVRLSMSNSIVSGLTAATGPASSTNTVV